MQQLRLFLIPTGKSPYINSLILSGKASQFRGGDNATLLRLFNAEIEHLKDGEKVVVPYGVTNQPLKVGDMYLNIKEKRVGKVMAGQEMGYQDWKIILQPSYFDNAALVKMYNDIKGEFWFTIHELGTKEVKTEWDAEKKKEKTNKPDNTDMLTLRLVPQYKCGDYINPHSALVYNTRTKKYRIYNGIFLNEEELHYPFAHYNTVSHSLIRQDIEYITANGEVTIYHEGQEKNWNCHVIELRPSDFKKYQQAIIDQNLKDGSLFNLKELEINAKDVQIGIEKKNLIRAWEDNPSARKVLETLYPSVFIKPLVSGNVLEVIQKGESRFLLIAKIKKLVMTRGEEAHVQLIQLEKGQNVVAHHVLKQPLKREELVTVLTCQNYFDNNHPHELVVHESIADVFDRMRNVGASEVKQRIVELSEPIDETKR
jgi:hypothetical protein